MEGTVITSSGMPLANVEVRVDYSEGRWLAYSKTRHKAETKTDKNGKYRLFFLIKDDELGIKENRIAGVLKTYSLIFDIKHIPPLSLSGFDTDKETYSVYSKISLIFVACL